MQGVLDAAWTHLLPAMTSTTVPPSPAAEQLTDRLSRLHLEPVRGQRAPESPVAAWAEASFLPAGGRCAAQPTLTGMRLRRDGERWWLSLEEDADAFGAAVGIGDWQTNLTETDGGRTGVPLAISGGWIDRDTFIAEVIFLETPHRLELSCSLSTATFQACWQTVPLRAGHLSELRMPAAPAAGITAMRTPGS
jgi:hypothetical protein